MDTEIAGVDGGAKDDESDAPESSNDSRSLTKALIKTVPADKARA